MSDKTQGNDDTPNALERTLLAARNGLKHYARLDRPPIASTPNDVIWRRDKVRVLHYRRPAETEGPTGPPLLLVHSLVNRSYIFDLVPGNSVVETMMGRGFDVYLIDWGVPDEVEAQHTLGTYCDDYLPEIVTAVADHADSDELDMLGYCFGAVLSLLYVAGHDNCLVRRLITLAAPIDNTEMPPQLVGPADLDPDLMLDETGNLDGATIARAMRALRPTADLAANVGLLANLWNDDYVAAHNAITMWGEDAIPFAGAAMRETATMLVRENAFVNDTLELSGRPVSLADVTLPLLNVYGTKDHIVPAAATRPLTDLVGSDDVTDLELEAGHVGLFIGRRAHKNCIPAILDWLEAD